MVRWHFMFVLCFGFAGIIKKNQDGSLIELLLPDCVTQEGVPIVIGMKLRLVELYILYLKARWCPGLNF